ncbi:non-ribosomal peptide synthetase [Spirillospora sp. NBC_01491]|uniref:non-ribosomal peptide synthetase n=1 Tax=Spirillospora sp. NBC_01491 TaxID=2976007 RepID=UPI002E32B3E8|nr:non-ribosomal peptide synthetase [Spirillospora sp. NBC_01491]
MGREPGTVLALVERQCEDRPEAVAVELPGGGTRTYADLRRRVARIASAVRPRLSAPGARVAVDLPNGLDFCAAVLAVLGSGAVVVAVDRTQPPPRAAAMLGAAAPEVVITDRPGGPAVAAAPGSPAIVDLSPAREDPAREDPTHGDPAHGDLARGPADPGAPAYVIFTSGTTGTPKATLNTHAGLLNHMLFIRDVCPLPDGSRVLLKSARSFDAWILEFFWAFTQGHTLVLADEERATDARYLAAELAGRSIHGFVCVPSLLRRVLAMLRRTGVGTELHTVISAGEALKADLAAEVLTATGARLFNLYGPAEAAIDVAYHPVEGPRVADPLPIGRPIPGNRLTVRDAAGRDITRTGGTGELVVTGVHVGLGYAGDTAATAARFGTGTGGERSYATGDLAYLGPDENFYIGGRVDAQVKINGVRVETAEIEACLSRHRTVADCTVQVTRSGEVPVLVAFIQADGDAAPESEYINYLRGLLPPVMVPPAYVFLTEFKKLPSGKKDTSALVYPRGLPTVTAADFEPPAGPDEQELAGIWEAVLGVAPIGALDEFALVGGDSLKMIDVLVKISESLYPDVFGLGVTRLSTVRDLAGRIRPAAD